MKKGRVWKIVKNTKHYLVSRCGIIKNAKTGRELKASRNNRGYLCSSVAFKDKGSRPELIHRIVATAFIRPPNPGEQVNHKDGDKTNNHVSNLEWVTASENIKHAITTGLNKSYLKNLSMRHKRGRSS